ncbi:hypothetical protein HK100_003878 [Physocladia obscura]|uniref:Uncharacterized protein n=1 Tax=Physocladia obscura TaxID=109957 RepID=A0AAD5XIF9_9FUNG|nr:hypothetical protein HK100_003878 [Physocladia obscura]
MKTTKAPVKRKKDPSRQSARNILPSVQFSGAMPSGTLTSAGSSKSKNRKGMKAEKNDAEDDNDSFDEENESDEEEDNDNDEDIGDNNHADRNYGDGELQNIVENSSNSTNSNSDSPPENNCCDDGSDLESLPSTQRSSSRSQTRTISLSPPAEDSVSNDGNFENFNDDNEDDNEDGDTDADDDEESRSRRISFKQLQLADRAGHSKPSRRVSSVSKSTNNSIFGRISRYSSYERSFSSFMSQQQQQAAIEAAAQIPKRVQTKLRNLPNASLLTNVKVGKGNGITGENRNSRGGSIQTRLRISPVRLGPIVLPKRRPQYARVAYPMASVIPVTGSSRGTFHSSISTVIMGIDEASGIVQSKLSQQNMPLPSYPESLSQSRPLVYSAASERQAAHRLTQPGISIREKKDVIVGYFPPPSSGLSFVPISLRESQINQQQLNSSISKNGSKIADSPQKEGFLLASWDTHSRRMAYDEIVRTVSRQSMRKSKRKLVKADVSAFASIPALLSSISSDSVSEVLEDKKFGFVQAFDNQKSRKPSQLFVVESKENEKIREIKLSSKNTNGNLSTDEKLDTNLNFLRPSFVVAMAEFDSENEKIQVKMNDNNEENGREDDENVDSECEDDVASRTSRAKPQFHQKINLPRTQVLAMETQSPADTIIGISPENLQLLRMTGVIGAPKPSKAIVRKSVIDRETSLPASALRMSSPGDVIFGRRGSIHAIPTITRLTQSEINLLTTTTGQFRGGARDPHHRFLRRHLKGVKLSGPGCSIPTAIAATYFNAEDKIKERAKNDHFSKHSKRIQGAQAMREHQWAISQAKYTVGSGTGGFDHNENGVVKERDERIEEHELRLLKVSNPAKYKRLVEKEKAKVFLLTKWEALEQLRIQSNENSALRAKHNAISFETNTKISKTLEQNEAYTLDIIRIDKERKAQFQVLREDYESFVSKSEKEIAKLEHDAEMTRQTVEKIAHEIDKLIEFKAMKESNPTAIANKIKEARKDRDEHVKQFNQHIKKITAEWKSDQAEIEQTWMSKVKSLIDGMGDVSK